jgi:hypothetical protein
MIARGVTPGVSARGARAALALRAGAVLLLLSLLFGLYAAVLHPWLLNWGATPAEQRMVLPGDAAGVDPAHSFTRAITVDAPPEAVWPWLVQIGQDRAGFYSYDWLENLAGADIHNADEIRAEWQSRAVGDTVPLARPDYLGGAMGDVAVVPIRALEPGRMIDGVTGRFVLLPTGDGRTRLLLRERVTPGAVAWLLWDPLHFVMEQRQLRGIKERAEGRPLVPAPLAVAGRAGWALAGLALAVAFHTRRRWLPWGIASAAAVLPSLAATGDGDAALAGFLALGGSVLGALVWGRRWLAPYGLIAAAVLLVLLLTPDAWVAFGLLFDAAAAGAAFWALGTWAGGRRAYPVTRPTGAGPAV